MRVSNSYTNWNTGKDRNHNGVVIGQSEMNYTFFITYNIRF